MRNVLIVEITRERRSEYDRSSEIAFGAAGRGPLAGAKKRLMILFFTLSLVMNSINRNPEKKMTDKLNKS